MTQDKLSFWVLALSFFFSSLTSAAIVSVDEVNVRSGPAIETEVVVKVLKASRVKIVEKKDDWYLVETEDNHVGWVQGTSIKLSTGDEAFMPAPVVKEEKPLDSAEALPSGTLTPEGPTSLATPAPLVVDDKKGGPKKAVSAPDGELTHAKPYNEFKEVMLALRPGFARATTKPTGMDKDGFFLGGHTTLFFFKYVGLSIPYSYTSYSSNADFHSIGGGLTARFVDWSFIRGEADGNVLYVRGLGKNHMGWSVGGDLTFGWRNEKYKPFIGPFFRFEKDYIGGPNLSSMIYGLTLNLTNLFELDI